MLGASASVLQLHKRRRLSSSRWSGLKAQDSAQLIILNYHRVLPQDDPFAVDAISVRDFQKQVKMICKNFRMMSLTEAVKSLREGKMDRYSVCLTFDDGYRDNYDHAFPVLAHYDVPATIFLTTDFINEPKLLWHDHVLLAFKNSSRTQFNYKELDLNALSLESTVERRTVAFRVLEKLKAFSPSERDALIDSIKDHLAVKESTKERLMLRWSEIAEMAASGISFGAHTQTHPILSTLNDAEVHDEILGSKQAIEHHLGSKVTSFAYPNGRSGDYDHRAIKILKSTGFECAVTTTPTLNRPGSPLFELGRQAPWETNPHRLYAHLVFNRQSSL